MMIVNDCKGRRVERRDGGRGEILSFLLLSDMNCQHASIISDLLRTKDRESSGQDSGILQLIQNKSSPGELISSDIKGLGRNNSFSNSDSVIERILKILDARVFLLFVGVKNILR